MENFFRGRRLRSSPILRELVRETALRASALIMPYFVVESATKGVRKPIASMPGQFQLSLDELDKQVARAVDLGLKACLLFGIPAKKDPLGSGAYAENGITQQAVARLKKRHGDKLIVITDVCLCEYTSHGHCGMLNQTDNLADNLADKKGVVLNDPTL
ncbi:MAG: porphobilinogen synthase, partial [Deltaproteobacteria bacterium]|nr:porphobilinogen synthase [Deltaproteobacteria bacterium]